MPTFIDEHTYDFGHAYVDMYAHLYYLEETDSLLFTFVLKKAYFSIYQTLFNKCFFLPQSTSQFRVSVRN